MNKLKIILVLLFLVSLIDFLIYGPMKDKRPLLLIGAFILCVLVLLCIFILREKILDLLEKKRLEKKAKRVLSKITK